MIKSIQNYVKTSLEEMKKVTWPTWKETRNFTTLVIIISLGVAAYLGILDFAFTKGLELVLLNRAQ